ncbi:SMI1/KNR4 family protein [Paenibacillus sp. MBLB4367]|uniref:SMI1/KNR4 family protein n=1 Tax=Paenibacillus sp. MBLB4367 TaxID=3384767 RepID=UPI0039083248
MWMDLIKELTNDIKFHVPVTESQLLEVESLLQVDLPDSLKEFLLESNGVIGEYGCDIIWTLERIKKDNQEFRKNNDFKELYMPFDHLLFFSDAGNGDQFAFPILNGKIVKEDIYVWNHEDDSRTWISSSLSSFIKGWLNGTIRI